MKEEYLHYIWKKRRFKSSNLALTDGRKLEIINVGWHNHDAGPDFFNGTVKIDGLRWTGNIEIHIRSSDWYKHRHHLDNAYDNVILHVVVEDDKDVEINSQVLPTLSLKNLLDKHHLESFNYMLSDQSTKPCINSLRQHLKPLQEQIEISFFHRVERKGLMLMNEIQHRKMKEKEALLYSIGKALGGRLNKEPMQELFSRLPFRCLVKESWDNERIDSLIFGTAGLLEDKKDHPYAAQLHETWRFLQRKYGIEPMKRTSWKFKGVRPHSFPTRRLAELASFVSHILSVSFELKGEGGVNRITKLMEEVLLDRFWSHHFTFSKESNIRLNVKGLSKQAQLSILINAVGPYLIYRKHQYGEHENQELILDLFLNLKAENNSIIEHWRGLDVEVKNALDSQGLLELNNEFCIFRKCLDCQVGNSILESS